jgi:DNA-binding NarL/FixJ family response regulator
MMPEMDGHEVLANIRSHLQTASIPVIFLTARDSIEEQAASLQEGVVHYLTKPFQPQVLLATIETVLEHDREVASAQIAQLRSRIDAAFDDVQQQTVALPTEAIHRFAKDHHLSEREEEILHLIASGNSDKEIAATLGLSHRTIASHNQRIYQKAEVRGRYELISSIYAK